MKKTALKISENQFSKIIESLEEENQNLEEQSRLAAIGSSALNQMNVKPEMKTQVKEPKPGIYKTTVQITNDKKLKLTLPEGTFEYSCHKHSPTTKKV